MALAGPLKIASHIFDHDNNQTRDTHQPHVFPAALLAIYSPDKVYVRNPFRGLKTFQQ